VNYIKKSKPISIFFIVLLFLILLIAITFLALNKPAHNNYMAAIMPYDYSFTSDFNDDLTKTMRDTFTLRLFATEKNTRFTDEKMLKAITANLRFSNEENLLLPGPEAINNVLNDNSIVGYFDGKPLYTTQLELLFSAWRGSEEKNVSLVFNWDTYPEQTNTLYIGTISTVLAQADDYLKDSELFSSVLLNPCGSLADETGYQLDALLLEMTTTKDITIKKADLGLSEHGIQKEKIKVFHGAEAIERAKKIYIETKEYVGSPNEFSEKFAENNSYETGDVKLKKGDNLVVLPLTRSKNSNRIMYAGMLLTYSVNGKEGTYLIPGRKLWVEYEYGAYRIEEAFRKNGY
jgi:hypothetical protein